MIVYAENGFWYDTLTELIKLRRQNPQDAQLKADWEDLLQSPEVGLPNIATEPIVSCCQSMISGDWEVRSLLLPPVRTMVYSPPKKSSI